MAQQIDRRKALAVFGSVGLGVVAAACGSSGPSDAAKASEGSAATSTTGAAGASGAAGATGAITADMFDAAAACSLTPEETEGPFWFDVDSVRSDIREDETGSNLRVGVRVRDASSCAPLASSIVELWHADAEGNYSGFDSGSSGGGPGGGSGSRSGTTYLRGSQVTNADGIVEFLTVYPGWYPGRAVHIHAKVHLDNSTLLTTQFFFDEDFTDSIYTQSPYASRGTRTTSNADDNIFDDRLLLTQTKDGDGSIGLITLDVNAR
jgi:protocatechuate 3,4-dioxygenase beta subunit